MNRAVETCFGGELRKQQLFWTAQTVTAPANIPKMNFLSQFCLEKLIGFGITYIIKSLNLAMLKPNIFFQNIFSKSVHT